MRVLPPLIAMTLLASCVAPPPVPQPRPMPAPPLPVAPAPPPEPGWEDRALTAGTWTYAPGLGSAFGVAALPPIVTLRCAAGSRMVTIALPGAAGDDALTITTTYAAARFPAQAGAGGLMAQVNASDPFLDKMAFSRGRFMIAAGGLRLIVPAWPEVARVIEDCRK